MKKCDISGYDFDLALLMLQSTPLVSDLPSPAVLLQGRRFRITLPRMFQFLLPHSWYNGNKWNYNRNRHLQQGNTTNQLLRKGTSLKVNMCSFWIKQWEEGNLLLYVAKRKLNDHTMYRGLQEEWLSGETVYTWEKHKRHLKMLQVQLLAVKKRKKWYECWGWTMCSKW